jgi:integrase
MHLSKLFIEVQLGMLTDEKIQQIVSELFTQALAGFEEFRIEKLKEASAVEKDIANLSKGTLKELLRKNSSEFFMCLANLALEEKGIAIEPDSLQYKKLLREMLKMFSEVCAIEKERAEGNFWNDYDKHHSYTSIVTQNSQASLPKKKKSIALSELFEKYAKEKKMGGNWRPKTELDFNSYIETLIEIIGDIEVGNIDNQLMLNYRDKLAKLPANRKKIRKYRTKSIPEILQMQNVTPMSITTVNGHLSFASTLLKWGVKRGFIDKNYAEGLVYRTKVKPSDERNIYDTADLLKIIHYIATIKHNVHTERYWVPLIAMLSGLRLNEICQLHKQDIYEIDGVYCFDINNNASKKRLKSLSSARKIPIHPILIELGLIGYVKKIKVEHIWPQLKYDKTNGYGYLFQKWFQRTNRSKITTNPKKTFHSFRHSFTDNLKQKEINGQLISEIVGHSTDSITMNRYGKSYNLRIMLDAMNQLDYDFDIIKELEL